jgi:hypothetical protein
MEGEDKDRFSAMLARIVSEHLPRTDSELELVETMAVAKWRQKRIWAIENARVSEEIRNQSSNPELAAKALSRNNLSIWQPLAGARGSEIPVQSRDREGVLEMLFLDRR